MKNTTKFPVAIYQTESSNADPQRQDSKDCDCSGGDCACSLPNVSSLRILDDKNAEVQYKLSPESNSIIINDRFAIFYGPYQRPTVLNGPSNILRSCFEIPAKINDIYPFYKDSWGEDLFNSSIMALLNSRTVIDASAEPKLVENSDILTAWLHITDRCNLRCDYCYLPHRREDMTMDIGRTAVDATFRSAKIHGYPRVKLKYAGGEALIRFSFVEELHNYAMEKSKTQSIALNGLILSNGTLITSEIAKKIKSMNLSLMISLDGIGEKHDVQRHFEHGKPSFKLVERGIKIAKDEGISPHISITLSSKNSDGLAELIHWILENDLTFNINFYRENELAFNNIDLDLDEEKIMKGILAAYKVIENNLPRRELLSSLVDRANLSSAHLRTCGVGNNYMVFDYKGMVSKCQMQLHKPVARANVEDPLSLIRLDTLGIQNLSVEEKEGCKTCEWKYWCAGGCSLTTHRATGRYDVKSPNCRIYKAIYPEAVRLEGLRLLKYSGIV